MEPCTPIRYVVLVSISDNVLTEYVGVPHRVVEDDMYNGIFIPKGATMIANLRQVSYSNLQVFSKNEYLIRV